MTKIIIIAIALQFSIFAQIPQLVHTPEAALENQEAQALKATAEDMKELFACSFKKNKQSFKLKFLTTGQEDIMLELHDSSRKYSHTAGRTLTSYSLLASMHDYSSQNYNYFMKNMIVNFLTYGEAQLNLNLNSYCPSEQGHTQTKWRVGSRKDIKYSDIYIDLNATTKERGGFSQCMAGIGCALSEGWDLTSQTWRFLNDAENFKDWALRLGLANLLNPGSIQSAAKYDEKLSGTITIDSEQFELTCGDGFLPHYNN